MSCGLDRESACDSRFDPLSGLSDGCRTGRLSVSCGIAAVVMVGCLALDGLARIEWGIGKRFSIWFMESTCPDEAMAVVVRADELAVF